jgi:cytoskeletal protein RodZ
MELSVDVSDVSLADMKIRIKAFDFIKDLVSAKVNDTKANPETKQNKKNDKADNKTIKSTSTNIGNAKTPGCTWFVVISVSLIFFIIVLLISLWLRRDTLNPPNNSQPSDQVEEASNSALYSSSSTSELATSSDYIDPSKPAPSPEQYEPANSQDMQAVSNDMQDSQVRERIAAELELAKAKNDELLEERALVEERRLAAASNSNYVPQDKTTKIDIIPCEYTASSPLVCESRKDQPTTCAWSYSSCGSPRLQKKLSKSSCNNRVTLDVQNNQIIVTAGCRAEFVPEIN